MYKVGIYLRVRKACFVEGMSVREAARVFGLHRDTVRKMLKYSVPPGYQRDRPPRRPKLDPYKGVIDQILLQDLTSPKKQRHTAKRIYERLRDEHGFPGKYTIVKDYVRERRRRTREMFVPLSHSPGHAQCDFGEARVIIGGVERKAHYFALDLPHSDGCYVKAYPAETTESFCDGHVSAFAFLGGVPQSILYACRRERRIHMHTEMMRLDRIRIGIPALVSATVVVVLLAAAVWLQPWNSGTDQFLWEIGADQSILPVGSVAHASGGEPVEAADATVGPDLDKNWCENADGHYHELGPVMSVKYGQPGSSDLTTNPSPGHSLQVMEIVCESEERTGRGSRGTIVWKSPDSPWYGR